MSQKLRQFLAIIPYLFLRGCHSFGKLFIFSTANLIPAV
jgi:hypothetical protein